MTPDLPSRVREAFYATYNGVVSDNASPDDCYAATGAALAAVIAVVQEDRTREIVEWLRNGHPLTGDAVARWIEAKFGGTTHDE